MQKLGIVVSHPIQYHAPLFKCLSKKTDLTVFYCHSPNEKEIGKDGFGLEFKWDIDLLEGYKYIFLKNISINPSLSSFNGCNTPEIGDAIKKEGVTHVLIFGWYLRSFWQAFFYCVKNKIPIASRGDSQLNPDENKIKSLLKKIFYPLFIKRYDALLYVGERNKEYLLSHGATQKQLLFSPHAVDQDYWKPSSTEKKNKEKIRFIWVAKFIDKKRPMDVVKAFNQASLKNKNIELYMIGTGPLLDSVVSKAAGNPNIHFPGFKNQSELIKYYSTSHCLLLASDRTETWGLVVNEAFAIGIPAIVSKECGCSANLIENGITGFTYAIGDINELSENIQLMTEKVLQNHEYFQFGIEQKNKVHSYYNSCEGIIQFIRSTSNEI